MGLLILVLVYYTGYEYYVYIILYKSFVIYYKNISYAYTYLAQPFKIKLVLGGFVICLLFISEK